MNRLALFALLILPALTALAADDFNALLAKGDQFDVQLKTKEALAVYLEAEKLQPNNPELLYRIAKQYGESQADTKDKNERRRLGNLSLDYAKRAVAAGPNNCMCQLSVAVAYGRVAPYLDNQTKINYSKLVKQHADKALAIDPKNDLCWHVIGAWNYELANLNSVLRAIAQLIYGKLPNASNDDAVKAFKKAVELNPMRVGNQIELGRSLAAAGQNDEARAVLEKGLSLPNKQRDDPETKERGRAALKKL